MPSAISFTATAAAAAVFTLRRLSPKTLTIPAIPSFLFLSSLSFQPLRSSPNPKISISDSTPNPNPDSETNHLSALPENLRQIVAQFQSVSDSKLKYQQLLHFASQLPPLDPAFKTETHRVRGCVSQVWVRAFFDPENPEAVKFEADSDSVLTKGLAALLVFGLSGARASDIARVPPEFVQLLGLRQSLTPSRNNGFLNMLRLMQTKAMELYLAGGSKGDDGGLAKENDVGSVVVGDSSVNDVSLERNYEVLNGNSVDTVVVGDSSANDGSLEGKESVLNGNSFGNVVEGVNVSDNRVSDYDDNGGATTELRGRMERIKEILGRELSPLELEVEDISYQHAGHAGIKGSGDGETHFNVRVVSKEFEGKSLVKRHRLIYSLLQDELQNGLHALSIDAKTPAEVQSV